ncbi:hypothetical protein PIB30_077923, partial [Stylosanthes scabra]|nr:hypothetical protein [Stylosanthes scabra]
MQSPMEAFVRARRAISVNKPSRRSLLLLIYSTQHSQFSFLCSIYVVVLEGEEAEAKKADWIARNKSENNVSTNSVNRFYVHDMTSHLTCDGGGVEAEMRNEGDLVGK